MEHSLTGFMMPLKRLESLDKHQREMRGLETQKFPDQLSITSSAKGHAHRVGTLDA